ncbi:MAG: class I SAM-dependent methyltransferase [Acidimicrobiales bacterium]
METNYVLRGGRSGRERLRVLAAALNPLTSQLLDRIGAAPDARCLDVGCGGGDVTTLLAERAPAGSVVGVDADADVLDIARHESHALGLANVRYEQADAAALDGPGGYDLVYARCLLSHLPDHRGGLANLIDQCRPGGVVAVEDIEIAGAVCWPPCPAFDEVVELFVLAMRARGGEPALGPRLPTLLHEAGLLHVQAAVSQPGGLRGPAKQIQLLTLLNSHHNSVALGLTTPARVEQLIDELSAHVEREDTFITTARVVQAWGVKPG